ncbi:MAG: sulfatase-like hydrolase/transferase [Planctomycetota bacterium]|nr:sulfatase-like hydrolase/transferase [Planctomycetota bacterium]
MASLVLDRSFGLSQGFDTYEGVEPPKDRAAPKIEELRAPQVLARAKAWLAARDRERPFFTWVHLFDAHDPYEPPKELAEAYKSAYLGEIAFMDRALGEFLDALRADGTLEQTLVVIVGDHGEGLRQHQETTHGWFCYESTVRVPMLVRFPDGWRKGERSAEIASVVDVFPTALSALGLDVPRDLDGTSLDHALVPEGRGVYFECFNGAENFGWSPLVGWADAKAKYIHSSVPELYDVLPDAREVRNVAGERPQDVARMLDQIRRVRARAVRIGGRGVVGGPRRGGGRAVGRARRALSGEPDRTLAVGLGPDPPAAPGRGATAVRVHREGAQPDRQRVEQSRLVPRAGRRQGRRTRRLRARPRARPAAPLGQGQPRARRGKMSAQAEDRANERALDSVA